VDGYKVLIYNLDKREMHILAAPGNNKRVWEPFIHGNMIVWQRTFQIDQTGDNSLLEWSELP